MTEPALADEYPEAVTASVPCAYCRSPIPAESFTYWSAARRLLSAPCPHCHRRVTLAASTWQRWIRTADLDLAEAVAPASAANVSPPESARQIDGHRHGAGAVAGADRQGDVEPSGAAHGEDLRAAAG
jgi:hypothetical protein